MKYSIKYAFQYAELFGNFSQAKANKLFVNKLQHNGVSKMEIYAEMLITIIVIIKGQPIFGKEDW